MATKKKAKKKAKKKGSTAVAARPLGDTLSEMRETFLADPDGAVRSQDFIKPLHEHIAAELRLWLTPNAIRKGVIVKTEAKIHAYVKTKDVDVALIDPLNGPLMLIGVRSQMSSVGNNTLGYWEMIIGECVTLQTRFPMSVHAYVYLLPYKVIRPGSEDEHVNHTRFARIFSKNATRIGNGWEAMRGYFDQFAFMIVDFANNPPTVRDEIVTAALSSPVDISIKTFVKRLVTTYNNRFGDIADYLKEPTP
jgi:hypothetical protein